LELRDGDIVDVMEKCDDGWFVGKNRLVLFFLVVYEGRIRSDEPCKKQSSGVL
jgi:hypothetical protein